MTSLLLLKKLSLAQNPVSYKKTRVYSFRLQGVVSIVSLRHGWNICSLEFATQFRIENCKSSFTWALIFLHVVRDWVCAHVQGVCCHAGKTYSNSTRYQMLLRRKKVVSGSGIKGAPACKNFFSLPDHWQTPWCTLPPNSFYVFVCVNTWQGRWDTN